MLLPDLRSPRRQRGGNRNYVVPLHCHSTFLRFPSALCELPSPDEHVGVCKPDSRASQCASETTIRLRTKGTLRRLPLIAYGLNETLRGAPMTLVGPLEEGRSSRGVKSTKSTTSSEKQYRHSRAPNHLAPISRSISLSRTLPLTANASGKQLSCTIEAPPVRECRERPNEGGMAAGAKRVKTRGSRFVEMRWVFRISTWVWSAGG